MNSNVGEKYMRVTCNYNIVTT